MAYMENNQAGEAFCERHITKSYMDKLSFGNQPSDNAMNQIRITSNSAYFGDVWKLG